MQKCMECNAEVDQQAFACPKCGSETLMGSYDAEDAISMVDIERKKAESGKHVDRSNELAQQGQYAEAIKEAKIALEIAPLNPNAHNNIGAFMVEQGKPKEAIPWLQKAIKLNPKHECASIWLEQARSSASIPHVSVTSKPRIQDCADRDFNNEIDKKFNFNDLLKEIQNSSYSMLALISVIIALFSGILGVIGGHIAYYNLKKTSNLYYGILLSRIAMVIGYIWIILTIIIAIS